MTRLFLAALALIWCAAPAEAGPVGVAIAAIKTFAASSAIAAFIVRLGVALVISALQVALFGKQDQERDESSGGIRTNVTLTGGDQPQSFIIGRYATAGHLMAPPYSEPNDHEVPNIILSYVVGISDVAGVTIEKIWVDDQLVDDWQPWPYPIHEWGGKYQGGREYVAYNYYDGSQTAADQYLVQTFASDAERPWAADMIGAGLCYARIYFRYNTELYSGLPSVLFECLGVPLYDPRLDDTVGGTGPHRWGDVSTYAQTENLVVLIYNILRGITLNGGQVWGGEATVDQLPVSNWFAAMNACDQSPYYRGGYEVFVDEEPAAVVEELLKGCSAEIVETGGVYKIRVGGPALPIYFITDDDVIVDEEGHFFPHPGLADLFNGIHATYPAPDAIWQPKDAPPIYNTEWEAEDGGRHLVAEVDLPAVPYDGQVQRLMLAWIRDERRFRRHSLALPPDAAILEPLDVISWTSTRNGYVAKDFEIREMSEDPLTLIQSVSMRERDAGDFVWDPEQDEVTVTYPSTGIPVIVARQMSTFAATAAAIQNQAGDDIGPAIFMTWDGSEVDDLDGMQFEIRPVGNTELVAQGTIADVAGGQAIVSEGILPAQKYEARALPVTERVADWTVWVETGETPDLRPDLASLGDDVAAAITAAEASVDGLTLAAARVALGGSVGAIQGVQSSAANFRFQDGLTGWGSVAGIDLTTPTAFPRIEAGDIVEDEAGTIYRETEALEATEIVLEAIDLIKDNAL